MVESPQRREENRLRPTRGTSESPDMPGRFRQMHEGKRTLCWTTGEAEPYCLQREA